LLAVSAKCLDVGALVARFGVTAARMIGPAFGARRHRRDRVGSNGRARRGGYAVRISALAQTFARDSAQTFALTLTH
jgi:hypothetical protein